MGLSNREGRNSDREEVPGSGRSMRGYILTDSRLSKKSICQLWVLNGRGLNFCVRNTPLRETVEQTPARQRSKVKVKAADGSLDETTEATRT